MLHHCYHAKDCFDIGLTCDITTHTCVDQYVHVLGTSGSTIGLLWLLVLVFLMLALCFPIVDSQHANLPCLSFLLELLFFPVYGAIVAYQNPLKLTGTTDDEFVSAIIGFVFFPLYLTFYVLQFGCNQRSQENIVSDEIV